MITVYISAPISGVENKNELLFNSIEKHLRMRGYNVLNPLSLGDAGTWLDCMLRDLKVLEKCDCILMLDGWMKSYGCRIEYLVAHKLGIPIVHRLSDL